MLKYSVKISDGNIRQEGIVWREKYLSPDLSFVSGVTSQDYHLEKFKKISVSNSISHTPNSVLPIETSNVIREGFVVISGKKYDVEHVSDGTLCVLINGKYYYEQNGIFYIDKWLQRTDGLNVDELPYTASTSSVVNDKLPIDTISWIEDGIVTIDGYKYVYDFDLKCLRREYDNAIMESSDITECEEITCYQYNNKSDYKHVTKFKLTKSEEVSEFFENVSFIKYFYYILYKDNYLPISKNENNYFVCEIPRNIVNPSSTGVSVVTAYTDVVSSSATVTSKKVSGDTFDVLKTNLCYITIDNNRFEIQNDILNANNGSRIGIYLDNDAYNIGVGDIVYFLENKHEATSYSAYTEGDETFVLFNGERYNAVANLCDKAQIGDKEYDIEYINGKRNLAECIVHTDNGDLAMIINGISLIQKGLVVDSNSSVSEASYRIDEYSGVTINGVKYPIENISGETNVSIDLPNKYKFIVTDIKGSSLLICEPYLSTDDFSSSFIESISDEFCDNVVLNQSMLALYANNNIFGKREITKELAYNAYSGSTSSDDYFNLFDNLILYVPNSYIHIPLTLSTPQGNNLLQEDLIKRDFYEREKKKAINPIIDMEKDVYYPKYMTSGTTYSGSNTDFKDVNEIRFNLHFRTRNLDSWKVNEDYNNASTSEMCNWFITDYEDYHYDDPNDRNKALNSSDIIGLLGFVNDDVYFQRSKISKSFLRLSFYDSVDKQNQTLLATSTVFMNGRKLFKKFMDNSRKGFFNKEFKIIGKNTLTNKITTKTEYIGKGSAVIIDDNHRLGSEFIVNNKYEADSSSEGFYLYMFKEYSEHLTPKPIYMKVEFNHAGYGKTIPFIIPMKWSEPNGNSGDKFPVSALTLENSDELKKGIKIEDSNAQSYIPLYAVYDFKHKEYAYVFDDRYISVDENENLIFNLFEIKFANDTDNSQRNISGEFNEMIPRDINSRVITNNIENEQKKITYGKQATARIDFNKKMFGDIEKNCNI